MRSIAFAVGTRSSFVDSGSIVFVAVIALIEPLGAVTRNVDSASTIQVLLLLLLTLVPEEQLMDGVL